MSVVVIQVYTNVNINEATHLRFVYLIQLEKIFKTRSLLLGIKYVDC